MNPIASSLVQLEMSFDFLDNDTETIAVSAYHGKSVPTLLLCWPSPKRLVLGWPVCFHVVGSGLLPGIKQKGRAHDVKVCSSIKSVQWLLLIWVGAFEIRQWRWKGGGLSRSKSLPPIKTVKK
jgi:hypothetical protein